MTKNMIEADNKDTEMIEFLKDYKKSPGKYPLAIYRPELRNIK